MSFVFDTTENIAFAVGDFRVRGNTENACEGSVVGSWSRECKWIYFSSNPDRQR
jgi:hypothetical protein